MARKSSLVASSFTLCTASIFAGGEEEAAYAAGNEGLQPRNPNWEKEQIAQEALYQYLNPISSVTEGNLAVETGTRPLSYEVKRGDTLYGIGLRYGVNSNVLSEFNNLEDPRLIRPGQSLKIPVELKRIRVKEGETLTSIAKRHKVPVTALKEANPDLGLTDALYVGQVLVVPKEFEGRQTSAPGPSPKGGVTLSASKKASQTNRSFRWPVTGQITSGYGMRHGKMHTGIDIWNRKQENATIRPSLGGTVVRAGWGGSYGNMVVVDHGDGWSTYYAHLSRVTVSTGQKVTLETPLGYMGSSGNSTGPHLHFEVRRNGEPINPLNVLP
ncbi:murein DD-endopeptidase MepM/ murein hydrolase activator NlpD [Melghirimyces profundicolus]|uniref:Murein DD-endopeptidase MepM/ murein hydrolase activator NlpD n=1 Tax=Melghirimyces profundicolus TaxID=1242148 RepID=A0A2T6C2E1_9BACL|nr:M23 family metallopeptidase [Melghirimyces profundicolus]PTX62492.1 murein DD-endopeptidase MepM/ murein hydrolase activator NlpD [Melghirimyces profundicolus]